MNGRSRVLPVAAIVATAVAAGPVMAAVEDDKPVRVAAPEAVQPLYLEAEDLLPALESYDTPVTPRTEGQAFARRQGNNAAAGLIFSGQAEVLLTNVDVGTRMTLRFEVTASGAYNLAARFGQGPDHGIVQPAIDGRPVGGRVDLYSATPARAPETLLGRLELGRGIHTVTLTVTGKNDASTGLLAGLDYLELRP